MKLDLARAGLVRGDLVLLDTAPLVYFVEGGTRGPGSPETPKPGERRRAVAEAFFAEAKELGLRLATSTLTWTEILVKPLLGKDEALALRYRALLADSKLLYLAPLDVAIADEAARLRASLGLADTSRRPTLELADTSRRPTLGLADTSRRPTLELADTSRRPTLGLADAIQVATAIVLGAAAILTNDEAWRSLPACPRVLLLDELAFDLE